MFLAQMTTLYTNCSFLWRKEMKFIDHVTSEQDIKDHGSTHISSFSV